MCYKNGKDVIPDELLKQLQQYVQGEVIYIPRVEEKRAGWGESNGTRKAIYERNIEIYNLYRNGMEINKIMEIYHLSQDSIRKIVLKIQKLNNVKKEIA